MSHYGMLVKGDTGSKRLELKCEHQNSLLYITPSENSWVCSDDLLHVHALSGFFNQLTKLGDPRIKKAMQDWGLYYRNQPLETKITAQEQHK